MINYNSELLFPRDCKVLKIADEYVYPIFKNASSSLERECNQKIFNHQIPRDTDCITVYLREAQERYSKGVSTFLELNNNLHRKTLLQVINNGQLIDRHFMPQYFWIYHLYQYYSADIIIKDLHDLQISEHINKSNYKSTFLGPDHWIALDNAILNKFHSKRTNLPEINNYLHRTHRALYNKCIAQG